VSVADGVGVSVGVSEGGNGIVGETGLDVSVGVAEAVAVDVSVGVAVGAR
jgi:hypothetical protein